MLCVLRQLWKNSDLSKDRQIAISLGVLLSVFDMLIPYAVTLQDGKGGKEMQVFSTSRILLVFVLPWNSWGNIHLGHPGKKC